MVVMFLVVGIFGRCDVVMKKIGIMLVVFMFISVKFVRIVIGVGYSRVSRILFVVSMLLLLSMCILF